MEENNILTITDQNGLTHSFPSISSAHRWCIDNGYDIKYLDIRNILIHGDICEDIYKVNRKSYLRLLSTKLIFSSLISSLKSVSNSQEFPREDREPRTKFSTPYSSPYDFASNNFSYKITQFA